FRTPKKEKQTIPNIEEGENYEGF
ncbi:single-stranded DNA-binding protein, partial [Campylobacter coli]|nr:single-stranded DNA-binding protein [Campylobacter coli]